MPPIAQLPRSSDSNFSFEQAVTRQELEEMSVDYLEPPSTGEKFSVYRDKVEDAIGTKRREAQSLMQDRMTTKKPTAKCLRPSRENAL